MPAELLVPEPTRLRLTEYLYALQTESATPGAYLRRRFQDESLKTMDADCHLYSIVAWDPVSWPGNDFYDGHRATDDGVKAAATSAMHTITGIEGSYDADRCANNPPPDYRNWEAVVTQNGLKSFLR